MPARRVGDRGRIVPSEPALFARRVVQTVGRGCEEAVPAAATERRPPSEAVPFGPVPATTRPAPTAESLSNAASVICGMTLEQTGWKGRGVPTPR